MLDWWLTDVRFTLRWLLRRPAFTAGAVLSLAMGIGFTTAMFAVVDAALLRLPPTVKPDRLVHVYTSATGASRTSGEQFGTSSYPDYLDLRVQNAVFDDMIGYTPMYAGLSVGSRSTLTVGEVVTGNYFRVLGVGAALGRTLLPDDDAPGAPRVAVVSYRYWDRDLTADRNAVGQTVRLRGNPYTIIGVAPREFRGLTSALSPDLWVPITSLDVEPVGLHDVVPSPTGASRLDRRGERWLFVIGRLSAHSTPVQAQANLDVLMSRLAAANPATNRDRRTHVLPMKAVRFHPSVDALLLPYAAGLMFLVSLVLLIACANVAGMLLIQAAGRQREFSIRVAIGATPSTIVRQLVTESLILSGIGAIAGFGLASWIATTVASLRLPLPIPVVLDLLIDGRAILFTIGVAVCAGVLAGLAPAVGVSKSHLRANVGGDTIMWRTPTRRWTLRDALVSVQMAITFVLLVSAMLLVRSFIAARNVHLGLPVDRLAVIALDTRIMQYSDEQSRLFYTEALARIHNIPGVEGVTVASRIPFSPNFNRSPFWMPNRHRLDEPGDTIEFTTVSTDYFKTIAVPIVQGRGFTDGDRPDTPRVAVINETMARRYWPGESPIGKTFRALGSQGREFQIVGVTADYKVVDVGETLPFIHRARQQQSSSYGAVIARTRGDATVLLRDMQSTLLALEPNLIFLDNKTLEGEVAGILFPVRVGSWIASSVGIMALILAAIGLYATIAYAVTQRRREIGVRMALGAGPGMIIRLLMRQGLVIATAGLLMGGVGSALLVMAIGGSVTSVLRVIRVTDPVSWTLSGLVVLGVWILANSLPAWRAARTAPFDALRLE